MASPSASAAESYRPHQPLDGGIPKGRDSEAPKGESRERPAAGGLTFLGTTLRFLRDLFPWLRPAPPARRPGGTILFDVETLRSASEVGGWRNCHRMGVAVAVACFLEEDRFEVYPESRIDDLVAALCRAGLVVGFNVKRFDYRVLAGYTGEDYSRLLPTLDLFEDVRNRLGHRLGMDHLARETLGVGKSADGLRSLEWVRQGRLDLVEQYCRHDVEILRDLYLHGRREGYVFYRRRGGDLRMKLRVEW